MKTVNLRNLNLSHFKNPIHLLHEGSTHLTDVYAWNWVGFSLIVFTWGWRWRGGAELGVKRSAGSEGCSVKRRPADNRRSLLDTGCSRHHRAGRCQFGSSSRNYTSPPSSSLHEGQRSEFYILFLVLNIIIIHVKFWKNISNFVFFCF